MAKITAAKLKIIAYVTRKNYEKGLKKKRAGTISKFLEANKDLRENTIEQILAKAESAASEGRDEISHRVMRNEFKDAESINLPLYDPSDYQLRAKYDEDKIVYEPAIDRFGKLIARELKGFKVKYKYDFTRCDCRGDDMCFHNNGRYYLEFRVSW